MQPLNTNMKQHEISKLKLHTEIDLSINHDQNTSIPFTINTKLKKKVTGTENLLHVSEEAAVFLSKKLMKNSDKSALDIILNDNVEIDNFAWNVSREAYISLSSKSDFTDSLPYF